MLYFQVYVYTGIYIYIYSVRCLSDFKQYIRQRYSRTSYNMGNFLGNESIENFVTVFGASWLHCSLFNSVCAIFIMGQRFAGDKTLNFVFV